nr:hypothetical protein [Mycoplasmopsis bovis]
MNDEAIKNIQSGLNESAEQYKNYKTKSGEIEHYKAAYDDFDSKKKVPITVDFAVFEVDVDLEKADETFKSWINDAIKGLDGYINRLNETNYLPNQDKNISLNICKLLTMFQLHMIGVIKTIYEMQKTFILLVTLVKTIMLLECKIILPKEILIQ